MLTRSVPCAQDVPWRAIANQLGIGKAQRCAPSRTAVQHDCRPKVVWQMYALRWPKGRSWI